MIPLLKYHLGLSKSKSRIDLSGTIIDESICDDLPSAPPPTPTSPSFFLPKEDVIDSKMVSAVSQKKYRTTLFHRLISGDSTKINPNKFLNEQINCVPFIPNREMNRIDFKVNEGIGEGNFGTVFKNVLQIKFQNGKQIENYNFFRS